MAFNAKLVITDGGGRTEITFKVLSCDFGFKQSYDQNRGVPTGRPTISKINFVLESTKDTMLADWMTMPTGTRNGRIEFSIQNNETKSIEFRDAYCVSYHETFSHLGSDSPMSMSVSIIVRDITLDDNLNYNSDPY